MARKGYFSHSSADGTRFWKRILAFYPAAGYRTWRVGENLYWSSGEPDPHAAVEAWLQSPEHRVILLNRDWREFGIGAVSVTAGPGIFAGADVTIVTADFGVRR